MEYENLQQLIMNSSSSRRYLLSLSVNTQLAVHQLGEHIHTARDLHKFAEPLENPAENVKLCC